MQDVSRRAPAGAGWWSRLDDGSIRRVWAYRSDDRYVCLREISSLAQEAARLRLSAPEGTLTPAEAAQARAMIAKIPCDIIKTPDVHEAFAFLGGDNSARSALMEANPELSGVDFAD